MKLTNDILKTVVLQGLNMEIGDVLKVKDIWLILFKQGYRENMIRFLEVLEVRFAKSPYLDPGDLANALGAQDGMDHNETKFKIAKIHIIPADQNSEAIEDKGKYEVQCYGFHYIREREKFSEKETMVFSLKLD